MLVLRLKEGDSILCGNSMRVTACRVFTQVKEVEIGIELPIGMSVKLEHYPIQDEYPAAIVTVLPVQTITRVNGSPYEGRPK